MVIYTVYYLIKLVLLYNLYTFYLAGSFSCQCKTGWVDDGPGGDGKFGHCVNRDECLDGSHLCPDDFGICIDTSPTENGYICVCEEGFEYITRKKYV